MSNELDTTAGVSDWRRDRSSGRAGSHFHCAFELRNDRQGSDRGHVCRRSEILRTNSKLPHEMKVELMAAPPTHIAPLLGFGRTMRAWFVPPIVVPAAIAISVALIVFLRMRWGN